MKNITLVLAIALGFCATEAVAQISTRRMSRSAASVATPEDNAARQSRDRIINEVAECLKGKGVAPDVDITALTVRAEKNDAAALYGLAVACVRKRVDNYGEKSQKYLLKSAELGHPQAEVAVAIKLHSRIANGFFWVGDYCPELADMDYYCWWPFSNEEEYNCNIEAEVRKYYTRSVAHGFPCLTNMLVVLDQDIAIRAAKQKEKEQAQRELEKVERELRLSQLRRAGIDEPFVPFNEIGKMEYAVALEKAKENDATAYYWLAYYFSKGDGVERDGKSAWKFLTKAGELGSPAANYVMGQVHECESFDGIEARDLNEQYYGRWSMYRFHADNKQRWCATNAVAVALVESLYTKAAEGGLFYATNDTARFQKKIEMQCEKIARKVEEERKRDEAAAKALALLDGTTHEELEKEKEEIEKQKKEEAVEEAERALWSTWPEDFHWMDTNIVKMCEEEFQVVFLGADNGGWVKGCGKCFIEGNGSGRRTIYGSQWKKMDANGELLRAGNREDFEEYRWMTNVAARVMVDKQTKWAEEHGMTLDEARGKRNEFMKKNGSVNRLGRSRLLGGRSGGRGLGSLRERRAQREQQRAAEAQAAAAEKARLAEERERERAQREAAKEAERAEREKEREETQKKLAEMAAELQKQREAETKKGE